MLNVASSFDASVIEAVEQRELLSELDKPPEEDELETALNSIKSGKAGGKNGLTPELVKQVGCVFDVSEESSESPTSSRGRNV